MTYFFNGVMCIEPTEPEQCEFCGVVDECRPYGPNGEKICFDCGMLDREGTRRKMRENAEESARKGRADEV